MSPIKSEYLASYSKQKLLITLAENLKNSAIKLSIEDSMLLFFVNSSQTVSERLLVIAINKVQSVCYI